MISFLYKHHKLIFIVVILIATLSLAYLNYKGVITINQLTDYLKTHPVQAPLIFIASFIIALLFFSPTMPLNLLAGFIWGIWIGGVFTFIAIVLGSIISFFFSRYLFKEYLQKILSPKALDWIKSKTGNDGWKIVAFTRLNPIFPAALINYSFGLTSVSFKDFLLGTVVFSIPPTIAVAALGNAFSDFYSGSIKGVVISLVIGLITYLLLFKSKKIFSKFLVKK